MRPADLLRLLVLLPVLPLALSCSEPQPSRVDAVTGLWEITANFTEYTGSDYTTVPLTGPALHGAFTITEPTLPHGDYFTWDGVKGSFLAQPCMVFGSDGRCAQLGEELALDGVSGSFTLGPDGPGESGSYLSVNLAPMNGLLALQDIVVRGDSMSGRAGWIPQFGQRRPPDYSGTFVAHRRCSPANPRACLGSIFDAAP